MNSPPARSDGPARSSLLQRLRERGVLRVAASYAVIAWLVLQIASVVFDPLGVPKWVMTALIVAAAIGFPIALALSWFFEIGEHGVQIDHAADGVARPTARGLRHYADAVIIGALLIVIAVLAVRQSDLGKPKPPENPAIAVLPFENLSGDPQQVYFSDGLAEEMLDRLGRVPGLRVIARESSFSFRDSKVDVRTIAERLGVTTLLVGSVRRDGSRLRLSARLVDGATGHQVWSGSFDREMTDLFAVQAELAGAVTEAIIPAARGTVVENSPPPTTDLSAYDLYLLSRSQLVLRTTDSIRKAVDAAEQAVRLDPNFARGHAQLASALLFQRLAPLEGGPAQDLEALLRRAENAVHKALAIDPDLSEAHDAYGNLLRESGRAGAEEEYRRAIDLNPNNATAWHDYAVYLGNNAGRPADSLRAAERSLQLDPRQPVTWANFLLQVNAPGGRRYHEEFDRALRTVGDMPGAIDRVTLPGAVLLGYPIEIMKAGRLKQRSDIPLGRPTWINFVRAWSMVDPRRALQELPAQARSSGGIDFENARLFFQGELQALLGDWTALDATTAAIRQRMGADHGDVRSFTAFWLAARGRYAEAAQLVPGDWPPAEDYSVPLILSNMADYGAIDAVRLRIYRGTGRAAEAEQLAQERLTRLRAGRRAAGEACQWDDWMRYASVAAEEGLKDEAVDGLEGAMRCGDLPLGFQPQLPWFRNLEGYAPYDALLRERERRIARFRQQL